VSQKSGRRRRSSSRSSLVKPSLRLPRWDPPKTMDAVQAQLQDLRRELGIHNPLIGLDFATSLDPRPRWGFSQGRHALLERMIRAAPARHIDQLRQVASHLERYRAIDVGPLPEPPSRPVWINRQMTPLDAATIYATLVARNPGTYLEIGSGLSTLFARAAIRDHGLRTRIISIDPAPRAAVEEVCDVSIRGGLEQADLAPFANLAPDDLVLLDGTHRSFTNSDVTVFCLEVLPMLERSILIGVHDIHWPWEYSEMFTSFYWNEQYVLGSYLLGARDRVTVEFSTITPGLLPEAETIMAPVLDWWPGDERVWLSGGLLWFRIAPLP